MGDSLILQKLIELKILNDSTANHINHLNDLVSGLKSESWFYKSLPLIGVLVGGLITWLIQKQLKDKELTLTNFRELKDTSNRILTSLINLQFQLKELAYVSVDNNYQYYVYSTTENPERQRAYEEIYNNYKYTADIKNKIGLYVAEINSNFIAYYKLKKENFPDPLNILLFNFTNHILTLPKDPELAEGIEFTTEIFEIKQADLVDKYTEHISELLKSARSL